MGVLTADLVRALASVAGLTAVLVSSQIAFDVVRYVGAAYLIYLGIKLLLTRGTITSPDAPVLIGKPRGRLRALRPVDTLILGAVF